MTLRKAQAYFQDAPFREISSQVYLFNASHVLLFRRLRGPHACLISGPGGKKEKTETLVASAIREFKEETGLELQEKDLRLKGQLFMHFKKEGLWMRGYIFLAENYTGQLQSSCAEGQAFWCPLQDIPWQKMWGDEKLWLPAMLLGACFEAYFVYEKDNSCQHFLRLFT